MRHIFSRVSYLVSRVVLRPERAFAAIASYVPALDVAFVVTCGAIWTLFWAGLVSIREIFHMAPGIFLMQMAKSLVGYVNVILILALYGFTVSVTATLLGGKARLAPTILAFVLSGAVALGVVVMPVAVIKFVDFGDTMSPVSKSIVSVGPWAYIMMLAYLATLKVHKTVAPRAIAYLGLAGLPILLLAVFLFRYSPVAIPLGLG